MTSHIFVRILVTTFLCFLTYFHFFFFPLLIMRDFMTRASHSALIRYHHDVVYFVNRYPIKAVREGVWSIFYNQMEYFPNPFHKSP